MRYILFTALILLTACTTPRTVLKHPKTGQVAQCGGTATNSLIGGVVGYDIQKSNDFECVGGYLEQGFLIVKKE